MGTVLLPCSVHEVSVAHTPHRVAVKRIDWSTHEQRSTVAKVGQNA